MLERIKRSIDQYPPEIGFPIGATIGLAISAFLLRKLYKKDS